LSHSFILAAVLISAGLCNSAANAQEQETVKIDTVDGIRLHANFYASAKKNASTVILLHPIGEGKSSKSAEWRELAEALQKANYSVLMFDFRGHGESTAIQDDKIFWSKQVNYKNVITKNKNAIDVKDYIKQGQAYLPVLINDIAAVRAYLDRRNDDSKDCNTSSLIVIGAESGATLGAIWMNAEWHRYRYSPPPTFVAVGVNPKFVDRSPEGKDIIAAVFLSIQSTIEKRQVSLTNVLKVACKDNAVSAVFVCGKEDSKATTLAKSLEKNLKVKDSKRHAMIFASELDTNLSGTKLLQKSLGTIKGIVEHLDQVTEDRQNPRVDRDFRDTYFVWGSGSKFSVAKNKKGEKNLNFDEYNKFAQ
jgi:hypothetical protein